MEIKTLNDFLSAYTSAAKGSTERDYIARSIWHNTYKKASFFPRHTKKFIRPLKELVKAVPEAALYTHVSGRNNLTVNGATYDVLRLGDLDDSFIACILFDCCYACNRFVVEWNADEVHFETDDRDGAIEKFIEVTRDYLAAKGLLKTKEI